MAAPPQNGGWVALGAATGCLAAGPQRRLPVSAVRPPYPSVAESGAQWELDFFFFFVEGKNRERRSGLLVDWAAVGWALVHVNDRPKVSRALSQAPQ